MDRQKDGHSNGLEGITLYPATFCAAVYKNSDIWSFEPGHLPSFKSFNGSESTLIWATSWENLFMQYANNQGADQPAHPRSLISVFVVRCLDSTILMLATPKISRHLLASVAESYLVGKPKDRFSLDEAHITYIIIYVWFITLYNLHLYSSLQKLI